MPDNPKRNHHFVPQCLLKYWCKADGKLWEYDAKEGTHDHKLKSLAGMKRDFYTTRKDTAEPDFEGIEDLLGKVEAEAAPVIGFFLQHKRGLAIPTVIKFLFFVAVQYMRTPGMIEKIKWLCDPEKKKEDLLNDLCSNIESGLREKNAPEDFIADALVRTREFASQQMNEQIDPIDMAKISALRQVDNVTDELIKMTWCFLDVPDGEPDLLIGDHPVLLLDAGPDEGYPRPLGLKNQYLQIMMPISPRMIAMAGYDVECNYGHILPGVTDTINDMTCRFAHRYVYGSKFSPTIMARAVELRGTGPKYRVRPFFNDDGQLGFRPEFR